MEPVVDRTGEDPAPGANVHANGVHYRVWAPDINQVIVDISSKGGGVRKIELVKGENGFHSGQDPDGKCGDAYLYQLDDRGAFPDPLSRAQEKPASGRSLVIDPKRFKWTDHRWSRPRFRDLVFYELHVGTFTPEGTFLNLVEKLPYLRDLGINAIQLMPIADWPGKRNWGYDGVFLYAPAAAYGTPDDLRHFVNRAHSLNMAVILDVVYNHFGPSGNVLGQFSKDYFHPDRHTPWGSAFNLDGPDCQPTRDFFKNNPAYWMEEFHIDGFRFDATHEISDSSAPHLLAEMTESIHARGGYAIAEDNRNDVRMMAPPSEGGLGFDAVWADDFHHNLCVSQTHQRFAWFGDFTGSTKELIEILDSGWLYSGQWSGFAKKRRGTPGITSPPQCFVHCISNHDQAGNRAMGDRLGHRIPSEAYRMLSMLLMLTPYTPMLFMGQEWNASTPFLYFTDHEPDLGKLVTEGRRREFSHFPEFSNPEAQEKIPDPQAEETFTRSKLQWKEQHDPPYAEILALYRKCLGLRREHHIFRPDSREGWKAAAWSDRVGTLSFDDPDGPWLLLFSLEGRVCIDLPEGNWSVVMASNETRFGGNGHPVIKDGQFCPMEADAVLLRCPAREKAPS